MSTAGQSPRVPELGFARFIAHVPGLLADRAEGLRRIAAGHGDVIRIPVPGKPIILLSAPEHARHVLQSNNRNYRKSFDFRIVRELLGDGLVTSHDEVWRHGRQCAMYALKPVRIEECAPKLIAGVEREILEIVRAKPASVPAFRSMARITLRVLVEALLEVSQPQDTDAVMDAFTVALKHLDDRLAAPVDLTAHFPTPGKARFARARATLVGVLDSWIDEKRAQPGFAERNDLLAVLIRGSEHAPEGLDPRQWIRDQLMTFLVAGHETSAVALSWTLWLLAQHPEWQERVAREASEVLKPGAITPEDLEKLPIAERVILEGMRLYPPVWSLGREAIADDVVGGFHIPAGSTVVMSTYVIQRKSELWPEPDAFRPERFADPGEAKRVPFAYFPFSGGSRYCIGEAFAKMELRLTLALFLREFEVTLARPAGETRKDPLISMRPVPDVELRLRPRVRG